MRPLLQHASRSAFANAAFAAPPTPIRAFASLARTASKKPSTCLQCQLRSSSLAFRWSSGADAYRFSRRPLSTTRALREDKKPPASLESSSETQPSPNTIELPPPAPSSPPSPADGEKPPAWEPNNPIGPKDNEDATSSAPATPDTPPEPKEKPVVDSIARVPAEDLPSYREKLRWTLSKRLTELMDELLPKIAVVTQKVNTYTGTDYSGIEALRAEIKGQEKLVKARRLAIEEAKQSLDAAHAQQASSQKEVVALLERKHSWSAADLERYMSLIRSEHVNDQAVREAKEAVFAAENALEEARTQLERRERAQYHEEQIWSDTIRRNSTWVTFGLMGLNIFLLLASLIVIEPWRRRRMVREIKTALEAHKAYMEAVPTTTLPAPTSSIEAKVDDVTEPAMVEPASPTPQETETVKPIVPQPLPTENETAEIESIPLQDVVPNDAGPDITPDASVTGAAPLISEEVDPQEAMDIELEVKASTPLEYWQHRITAEAQELLSERSISIRKIDYTTAIAQSAAAGAFLMGALIILLRPN